MPFEALYTAAEPGATHTAAELLPLVYDDLRRLAAHRLALEPPGQTLDPTGLVHEAYLRLVGGTEAPRWDDLGHFFAAAAQAMRRILVDNARRKKSLKRGGAGRRQDQDLDAVDLAIPALREDLLALDEALTVLAGVDPLAADVIQLRYFAGLTIPEAAQLLGISARTANRLWTYARAWLHEAIEGG
jgi:RNA polymerase sigma factor (TIGR02999 family)